MVTLVKAAGKLRKGIAVIILLAGSVNISHASEVNSDFHVPEHQISLIYSPGVSRNITRNNESDSSTYGVATSLKVGSGSTLQTLMLQSAKPAPSRVKAAEDDLNELSPDTGSLFVNNTELKLGKVTAKLGYQSISKDFDGFSALKKSNAVSDDIMNQFQKEKGLKRANIGLQFGADTNKLQMSRIKDSDGEVSINSLGYSSKNFGVSVYKRSVDKQFARINDLSTQERTDMALTVRQQFDKNATAAQVTSKDIEAVSNESGIERSNMRANFNMGSASSSVQMLNISDGSGDIKRNAIDFKGKNYGISWMRQSIGSEFKGLSRLAPVELGEFGNEYGMERTRVNGNAKLGGANLAMSFSKVSDGEGSITKQSIAMSGKNFNVKANVQDIDPNFKRIGDLTDSDKKQMIEEQGYKKTDLSANVRVSPSLGIDSFYMRSHNDSEDRDKSQLRNSITFAPNTDTKITMFRDQYSFRSSEGNITNYLHQSFGLDQKIGSLQFNGLRDTNSVQNGSSEDQTTTTTSLHLESDKKDRNWFTIDRKTVEFGDGRYENTRNLSILSKPMKDMNLRMDMLDIDRGGGNDEKSRNYSMDWKLNGSITATANISEKQVENSGVTNSTSYSISSAPMQNIVGMKNVQTSASFSKEETNGKTTKEDNKIRLESKAFGGTVTMEMLDGISKEGEATGGRSFKFTSDPDPKKWLHFDLGYATRDLGPGDPFLVRSMNIDMALSSTTKLNYNYFTYPEKSDGKFEDKGGSTIKLTTSLNKRLNLSAEYGTIEQYVNQMKGVKIAVGIAGKLSNGANIELFYTVNDLSGAYTDTTEELLRFKYDRYIDDDHYFSFNGTLKKHDEKGGPDNKEFESRLDFRTLFH